MSGVIATLVDSNHTPVARALADDDGQFTIRAPVAGTYRIEARRIAFRPTIDKPMMLEARKILLHTVVLTGAPVQLASVHTTAEQQCETPPDSGSAAFTV